MATEIIKRDLSKSLKAKCIDIPAMPVTVTLNMDDDLLKMAKSGKEGFRLQQLVDAANDSLDGWAKEFQKVIDEVDQKMDGLSSDEMTRRIDKLNDALERSLKPVEAEVNKDVEKVWKGILSRNKELRDYKLWTAFKTTAVTLGAAASVTRLVFTAGTDVISYLALVNTAANLITQCRREWMDMFKHHEKLSKMMADLNDTVLSDLNGFEDLSKSLGTDVSPALGQFMNSTRQAETELKSLRCKYIAADKDADSTVGKINAALDKLGKIKKAGIDAKAYKLIQDLEKQVDDQLKDMLFMRKVLDESQKDLDAWGEALQAWSKRNRAKAGVKTFSAAVKNLYRDAAGIDAIVQTSLLIKSLVA
jgi:flagellar biosynthesis chaperone FliJ